MQRVKAAHDCEKCHGKIIAISIDKLGNMYCGYCGKMVPYPKPTEEDIQEIKDYLKKNELR